MKKISLLIMFCLLTVMADALTFSGHIKTDSLKALPFVSVYFKDVQIGTTTDLDGYYLLKDIPAGRHTLLVSYVGYETQAYEVDLQDHGLHDFIMHEQTVTLDDVFISPTGESIERFILSQVVKNTKKLSKRIGSYNGTTSMRFEQRNNNMKKELQPYMGKIKFALGLIGVKKIFMSILDHPNLKLELTKNTTMKSGKLKADDTKMTYSSPKLDKDETSAWEKKDFGLDKNPYDKSYKVMAEIKTTLEKLDKKAPGQSKKYLKYGGSYEENSNTIQILRFGKSEFHIVDGIWQIRRIVEAGDNDGKSIYEFQQYKKDLYLPVSYFNEWLIDMSEDAKVPKISVKLSRAYSYRNIK